MDWFGELQDGDASLVEEALAAVTDTADDAYIEVDECSAALAAAELVAAARGGGDERLNEDARAWLADNRDVVARGDVGVARRAVERVFRASELRELWDENGTDSEWHADVRELLRRLTAVS